MLDERSLYLRRVLLDTLYAGGRGHLASALSVVEIVRVLYDDILRHRPQEPQWPERDRFILSKGHGCLGLYAVLADKGYFPQEELSRFCKPGGILGGHPETKVPGVEACTGSLGHGLPIGVGLALSARMHRRGTRVYVLVGDGECNEGSVWEAALMAAKHKLDNLTVLVDRNRQQSYDATAKVLDLEPFADKWQAFGFSARSVDGHNVRALRDALSTPPQAGKPTAVICETVKGRGIPEVERNLKWHHVNKLVEDEWRRLRQTLEVAHA